MFSQRTVNFLVTISVAAFAMSSFAQAQLYGVVASEYRLPDASGGGLLKPQDTVIIEEWNAKEATVRCGSWVARVPSQVIIVNQGDAVAYATTVATFAPGAPKVQPAQPGELQPDNPFLNDALKRWPDLQKPGTPMFVDVQLAIQWLRKHQPSYFQDAKWPVRLASAVSQNIMEGWREKGLDYHPRLNVDRYYARFDRQRLTRLEAAAQHSEVMEQLEDTTRAVDDVADAISRQSFQLQQRLQQQQQERMNDDIRRRIDGR